MPELTDEQILDIQDDAPSTDVSEAHEGTAPEDSSLNESTSEPIQETSNALETKTPDEVSEKPQPETAEKPQAEAQSLEEQFPGGRDQAAEVIGKASELDGIDSALHGGEVSDIASVVMNAWEQAGPAFPNLVRVALNAFEQASPQEHAQLVDELIRERLQEQGLVPIDHAAEEAAQQQFRQDLDTDITAFLNRQVERTAPPGFASAPADLQGRFKQAVHEQIQKWAKRDLKLGADLQNAWSGRLTRRARMEIAELVRAKGQSVLPSAMKTVIARPEFASLKVAAQPAQIATNRSANRLTQGEANRMTIADILASTRPVERRGTWRPGNELDEV